MGKSELKELWAFTVVLTLCHNILGSIELDCKRWSVINSKRKQRKYIHASVVLQLP